MADATPATGAGTTQTQAGTPPAGTAPATALGAPQASTVTPATGAATPQTEVKPNPEGKETPKPGSEAKAPNAAQGEIELKFPDGFSVDQGLVDKFKPLAKELNLNSEQSQKLADMYSEAVKGYSTKAAEAHQQRVEAWLTEAKTDKEVGGAEFDKNAVVANKAVERFGGQELREFFNQTGLGNHPGLFRAFVKIGKAISEDSVGTKVDAHTAPEVKTEAQILAERYPSMYNPDGTLK
jgi:hypothetical protein